MNNELHYRLRDLAIYYLPIVIFNSFLTGFLFFLFPAALLITITVNIVLLYVYNLFYFLFGLYIILVVLAAFTNKIVIRTFKNYGDRSNELDYKHIHLVLTVISGFIILILFVIVYNYFL